MHHSARQLVDRQFFFIGEAKDISGSLQNRTGNQMKCINMEVSSSEESAHVCGQQLLFVIDAGHGDLPLTYHGEVIRVCGNEEHFCRKKTQEVQS